MLNTNLNQLECSNSRRKSTSKKVSNTAAKIASKIGSWNPIIQSEPTGWCWLRPLPPQKNEHDQWKITILNRRYIFKWLVFYIVMVSFPGFKKKNSFGSTSPQGGSCASISAISTLEITTLRIVVTCEPPPQLKKIQAHPSIRFFNTPNSSQPWGKKEMHQAKPRLENIRIFHDFLTFAWWFDMGVSKNRDIPKWMVYNGKPY